MSHVRKSVAQSEDRREIGQTWTLGLASMSREPWSWLAEEHWRYLQWHRVNLFRKEVRV